MVRYSVMLYVLPLTSDVSTVCLHLAFHKLILLVSCFTCFTWFTCFTCLPL